MRSKKRNQLAVGSVTRIGPTHARGLDRLVGLQSNVRQGDPYSDMRYDFELSCGPAPLRVTGTDCEMTLRSCFVSIQAENCDMQGNKYEHWLDGGSFKVREIEKKTSGRSGQAGLDVQAGVDTKATTGFRAKFGFGAAVRKASTSEGSTEKNARIALISTSGQNRWRVGDPRLGDARTADGFLVGTYFREKLSDGDAMPLCKLACREETEAAQVTAAVSAPFGSAPIFRSDGTMTSEGILQGARTVLTTRSKQAVLQQENLLRGHVAGLVAAKAIREAQIRQGMFVAQNEFVVALETLYISPATDD